MSMRFVDLFASVDHSPAEEHGNEHTLPSDKVCHVGRFKKVAESFVFQNSPVKGLCRCPNSLFAPNGVIEIVDHVDPPDEVRI
jgi:hypothetical protein